MSDLPRPEGDRSVSIGRDATGNVIQTGDRNVADLKFQQVTLPPPESVDIRAELAALRETLAQLQSPDLRKIENALSDADDELAKEEPNKDEVGKALDRALEYAEKADRFAGLIETLKPHVTNAASWLGSNWHKILGAVGLAV